MSDERVPLPLTAEERRLILALREIPSSPLRDKVVAVVKELADLATEPACLEAQADGVPCGSEKNLCESCSRVLGRVRDSMDRNFPVPRYTLQML